MAGGDEGIRDHRWKFVVDKAHPGLADMFIAMVRQDQVENEKQRASIRALLKAHAATTTNPQKATKQKEEMR